METAEEEDVTKKQRWRVSFSVAQWLLNSRRGMWRRGSTGLEGGVGDPVYGSSTPPLS